MSELLDDLLAKPVGAAVARRQLDPERDFTRQLEVTGDDASVTVRGLPEEATEGAAAAFLRERGEDPEEWIATGFRSGEWTMANGETGVSNRYTFRRRSASVAARIPIDDLVGAVKRHRPKAARPQGDHGFLVVLGDMQFGKMDGDGPEGALHRTIEYLNRAADLLVTYRKLYGIGHVHVAWMGDHVEGFVSQGGANAWRTTLTLNDQIRLTRRVMLHAMQTFAPLAERVSMAAVPGNHGEPQRFAGKGVTRYDDSHDTESLIAVADAAALNPEAFGHVEFLVPETDELTVVAEVAGTVIAHAHGHTWRPGKQFEWWKGQAFNQDSALHVADVLLAGHLHHEHIERDGRRLYIGAPAVESESTWWRHATGTGGSPGLIAAVVKDGNVSPIELVR